MRKLQLLLLVLPIALVSVAQTETKAPSKKKKFDVTSRNGDHLMVQLAHNMWTGMPDSIGTRIKGLNKSVNVYLLFDKPFKKDPRFSIAFGGGIGSSNIFTSNLRADVDANSTKLPFVRTDSLDHYKKYKIATSYFEIPLELRFSSDPANPLKSIKGALGIKVGTLLSAWTKGRNLLNKSGGAISNGVYKIKDKDYFNKTKVAVTARVGYGPLTLFGTYYFSPVFKDGVAPDMKQIQVGLNLSGL